MTALAYGHRKNGRWTIRTKKRAAPDGSRSNGLDPEVASNLTPAPTPCECGHRASDHETTPYMPCKLCACEGFEPVFVGGRPS